MAILNPMGGSVDQGGVLDNILKNYYLGPVVQQLNNEVFLLSRIESSTEGLFGRQVILPLHTQRTSGIGARPEGGQLPDPGAQGYTTIQYKLKYLYGRIRVTGPAMVKTQNDIGSFLQALKSEMDGVKDDLKKDLARQVYGSSEKITGNTIPVGGIAKVASVSSLVVTLASSEAIDKGWLYVGQTVDIGTAALPQAGTANASITAVVPGASPTVTVSAVTGTITSSHYIFRTGSQSTAAGGNVGLQNEITGLNKLVNPVASTGSYVDATGANELSNLGGIDPFANAFWDNIRQTAVGALSQDVLMQNFNKVRRAGGNTSLMLGTFGIQRAFFNLLQSQVRYTDPMTLKGGFQTLEFQGKPFVADVDASYGQLFLLDERFIKCFSNGDWRLLDQDGNPLKWTQNYDAWETTLARYMQLGVTRRNVQCVLAGITDPGY